MNNNIKKLGYITLWLAIITFVIFSFIQTAVKIKAKQLNISTLSHQKNLEDHFLWYSLKTEFSSNSDYNSSVCTIDPGDLQYFRKDFNKSKIVGEFLGEKSKEFSKGIIEGVLKPSKHSQDDR